MGRHANFAQLGHQIFRDAVVQNALARDGAAFLVIAGGGVILEILDKRPGFGAFEQNLGLAFVDPPATEHT